jgi:hypothetical protein|tara:strand:+ start:1401 stop:1853 length:453 start_codon:yes stop_codon:yes gene_type:complete
MPNPIRKKPAGNYTLPARYASPMGSFYQQILQGQGVNNKPKTEPTKPPPRKPEDGPQVAGKYHPGYQSWDNYRQYGDLPSQVENLKIDASKSSGTSDPIKAFYSASIAGDTSSGHSAAKINKNKKKSDKTKTGGAGNPNTGGPNSGSVNL